MRRYIQIVTPEMNKRKELTTCDLLCSSFQAQGESKLYSLSSELNTNKYDIRHQIFINKRNYNTESL